jgi:hypothetical protein
VAPSASLGWLSRNRLIGLVKRTKGLRRKLTTPGGANGSVASWRSLRSPALRSIVCLADLGRRPLHLLVCQSLVPYRRSFGAENQAPNSKSALAKVRPPKGITGPWREDRKKLVGAPRFEIAPRQLTRRIARCQARFQKLGIAKFIAHDLRRTCRTYLSRLGIDQFIAERVLNHVREGIEGVYDLRFGVARFLPPDLQATCIDTLVRLGVPPRDVSQLVERMPKSIDGNYDLYEHLTEKRSTLERWESHLVSISNPSATTKEDHPPHMPAGRATMQIAGQQSLAEGGSGSSHTVDIQKTYTIP